VATGHHARVVSKPDGTRRVARGADRAKDQSYVVHMLDQDRLARTLFPIGHLAKDDVRAVARDLGLRTAAKPDSQDVCFITRATGRSAFLGDRIPLTPARVVDTDGRDLGRVDAVELVTLGQRKGLGLAGGGAPRYVLEVDRAGPDPVVTVGTAGELVVASQKVSNWAVTAGPLPKRVAVQCSAHGATHDAVVEADPDEPRDGGRVVVRWDVDQRRVAPGQSLVAYDGDEVVAGGIASV